MKTMIHVIFSAIIAGVPSTASAQSMHFVNRCVIKGTHSVLEFAAFLHVNGQWQHVQKISMQIRIQGQGSRSLSASNTNILQKNYTQFPWGCPRSCVSGYAIKNGTRYSSNGFCRGG